MTSNAINLQRARTETNKNDAYIRDLEGTRGFRNANAVLSGIGSFLGGAGRVISGGASAGATAAKAAALAAA